MRDGTGVLGEGGTRNHCVFSSTLGKPSQRQGSRRPTSVHRLTGPTVRLQAEAEPAFDGAAAAAAQQAQQQERQQEQQPLASLEAAGATSTEDGAGASPYADSLLAAAAGRGTPQALVAFLPAGAFMSHQQHRQQQYLSQSLQAFPSCSRPDPCSAFRSQADKNIRPFAS